MKNLILIILTVLASFQIITAEKKTADAMQRETKSVFDFQANTVSSFQFPVTNYGVLFMDIGNNKGGGYWPKGSMNQYMFAGGIWLGAKKFVTADSLLKDQNGIPTDTIHYSKLAKLVEITYNPNSGQSWMVPGRIQDGDRVDTNDTKTYRSYFSTDMDEYGAPLTAEDGPNWPVWDVISESSYYRGIFVSDIDNRNTTDYPEGPVFVSGEDIFCTYKDTDLSYFEGGAQFRKDQGYPLGLQFEQYIFSWGDLEKKDKIIIFYKVINTSSDTLYDCWLAPVYDADIALAPVSSSGAGNDRFRYYSEESMLNLAVGWTDTDKGEAGQGFGYIGVSMILTPEVDDNGFLLHKLPSYDSENQLGMKTYRNWPIEFDLADDSQRYDFMSTGVRDGDNGPGDIRILFATGPYNMLPNDTAYVATQINFSLPALGGEATGEMNDLAMLVEKVKSGKELFYNAVVMDVFNNYGIEKNDLTVYPNPVSDKAYIEHNLSGNVRLKIYDLLSNVVFEELSKNNESNVFDIDTKTLQSGNYVVCLSDGMKIVSGKMLVVK